MSAPRILFVSHTASLGGAEFSLLDLARHFHPACSVVLFADGPFRTTLQDAGIDVDVLQAPSGIHRVTRSAGLWQDLRSIPHVLQHAWHLAQVAREYDLVYANSQKSMIVGAWAATLARRPLVWHLRDLLTSEHFSRFHCRVSAQTARLFATRVIANSNATRRAYVGNGGRSDHVVTVHNGIDPTPFHEIDDGAPRSLRAQHDLEDVPLVGVFSRLAEWKGQHVLIDALPQIPDVHALLVGEALFEDDDSYAGDLRRRARHRGVADRVHFLGFRDDVPLLMHAVDVVAHTSIHPEPFGRVVVEGMCAQTPVIATRTGGVPEIISHRENGLLVPPADAHALASAIDDVLSNDEWANTLAQAGYRTASTTFSRKRMCAAVEAVIRQAAGAPTPARDAASPAT